MGGAADSAMGVAVDVLVANEETSLTTDLVVDVVDDESAIRVGGAADTVVEEKVAVDKTTLVVGGAAVVAIKVGGTALDMDKVAVTEAATEHVTEDSTVVATFSSSISSLVFSSLIVSSYDNRTQEDLLDVSMNEPLFIKFYKH